MVRINKNECIGCGICESICPEGFEMVDGKARVKNDKAECIEQAAESCPRKAIILDENKERDKPEVNGNLQGNIRQGFGFGRGKGMGRGRGFGRGRNR